ncbi:MAG: phosphoglucosamine mutase [Leptolyngbya sp. PLA2]|nr:phosphoglucosamine mutase [Leptolyngbya sp.]MCE7972094.1 phosphoglucosamine mutase [Leptolyngbya sp. PL-A2]MCQ3941477.1 phosphoglucosamine mutase [cyanobacterium CYA1]MCZ7634501.1 hypothetical protein [Phycisphaerales bacterium]MDL1905697.1 phosphoglucosamine mutase [Synechococcales cyanobacterium CNB]GIK20465.1 MAG: phosphoglucosamine mutase [Planctomycetota bacterium]
MRDGPLMVGVSGMRGIVGTSLTTEVAARFAAAFGSWLPRRGGRPVVVVGRDGRAGCDPIHAAAVAGLTGAGCDVIDLGVEMTPTVGVMVDELDAAGGLVVTASHNGQEWNGIKCLVAEGEGVAEGVRACAPPPPAADEIAATFRGGRVVWRNWSEAGRVRRRHDAGWDHAALVLRRLGDELVALIRERRYSVVLDSVNAAGVEGGRRLLESLGCRVTHLGDDESGVFPHPPEPTRENLGTLCAAVSESRADAGFAQDPDGDRLAIIDGEGRYVGEEWTLVLAARSVLEACDALGARAHEGHRGIVLCANLSTSRMIDDLAREHGARVVRTPVGEAHVAGAMKREGSEIGGEGNGGVIWPGVTCVRDSLSAMALVLALMARHGRALAELIAEMPAYAIEKRKVEMAAREAASPAVERVAAWASREGARADRQDGVRVDWDDCRHAGGGPAWVHVRASNTEPIMRLIAEARTGDGAARLLAEVERAIGR